MAEKTGQEPTTPTSTPAAEPKTTTTTPEHEPTAAELKAELDRARAELKSTRTEAAGYRKKFRETEAQKKTAEETALAEQGKFKELAEARQKELDALRAELEPAKEKLSTYEKREAEERARRDEQTRKAFDALPEHVRAAVPENAPIEMLEIAVKAATAKPAVTEEPGRRAPAPTVTPSVGGGTPRSFTEAEIRDMPLSEYEKLKPQILQAYREGRVK